MESKLEPSGELGRNESTAAQLERIEIAVGRARQTVRLPQLRSLCLQEPLFKAPRVGKQGCVSLARGCTARRQESPWLSKLAQKTVSEAKSAIRLTSGVNIQKWLELERREVLVIDVRMIMSCVAVKRR